MMRERLGEFHAEYKHYRVLAEKDEMDQIHRDFEANRDDVAVREMEDALGGTVFWEFAKRICGIVGPNVGNDVLYLNISSMAMDGMLELEIPETLQKIR